jgi:3-isopropylmalate dehydrogenase
VKIAVLAGDVYMASPRGRRIAPDGLGAGEPEGFDTMRYSRPEVRRIADMAFRNADAAGMMLLAKPSSFDTIVAPNLFGDLLSDIASMLLEHPT